jgi:hypothetical protein
LGNHRGQVDDPSGALSQHGASCRFRTEKDSFEIHIHDPFPLLFFEAQEQIIKRQPSIVDNDINASVLLDDLLKSRIHFGAVRHIEPRKLSLTTTLSNARPGLFSGSLGLYVVNKDKSPITRESFGNRSANSP